MKPLLWVENSFLLHGSIRRKYTFFYAFQITFSQIKQYNTL